MKKFINDTLIAAVYAALFILVLYGLFFCEEVLK